MTKRSLLSLASILRPCIQKRDTNYKSAVLLLVRLACSLFKFSHRSSLMLCSEFFAIGRSTISMMLQDVLEVVNVIFGS